MKKTFCSTFFLLIVLSGFSFSFNQNNYWNKVKKINYDSLYFKSLDLIEKDKISQSIEILNQVISDSKNKSLILNAYYDLGQLYLSRSSDYEQSVEYFLLILNNTFSYRIKENSDIKSFLELKEKSLFMIGYIYHNHIGDLTKAKKYYDFFLNDYPESDLISSVSYELEIINQSILEFNQQVQKK